MQRPDGTPGIVATVAVAPLTGSDTPLLAWPTGGPRTTWTDEASPRGLPRSVLESRGLVDQPPRLRAEGGLRDASLRPPVTTSAASGTTPAERACPAAPGLRAHNRKQRGRPRSAEEAAAPDCGRRGDGEAATACAAATAGATCVPRPSAWPTSSALATGRLVTRYRVRAGLAIWTFGTLSPDMALVPATIKGNDLPVVTEFKEEAEVQPFNTIVGVAICRYEH